MKKRNPGAAKKTTVPAAEGRRNGSNAINLQTVRDLAQIATEYGLDEVEADATGRIRVSRRVSSGGGPAFIAPSAPSLAAGSLSLMPALAPKEDSATLIGSPFVGTFYRAPSPEAANFVEVGQTVRKGQVVCIVEAMKLMNEIESDYDGKVLEILVKNGEHVEYGQALFRLEKL